MIKELPPLAELAMELSYDPETGLFVNVRRRNNSAPVGAVAGTLNKYTGYLVIRHKRKLYLAHRFAWLFATGSDPGDMQVDHINGIPADNRICNLRLATHRQNMLNSKKPITNTSGFKGVVKVRRNRFVGRIRAENGFRFTRSFKTPEEAAAAYATLAKEVAGEFVRNIGDDA